MYKNGVHQNTGERQMSLEHSSARQGHDSFNDVDAYSIEQFCRRHNISRSLFYLMLKSATGPDLIRLGSRVLISREAAARWRKAREEAAAPADAAI
jgi:hypothetical protein